MPTPSEILFIASFRNFGYTPDDIPITGDSEDWRRKGFVEYGQRSNARLTPRGADLLASADAAGFDTSEVGHVEAREVQIGDTIDVYGAAYRVSEVRRLSQGWLHFYFDACDGESLEGQHGVSVERSHQVLRLSCGEPKPCTACNDTRRVPVIGDFTNPCPACCSAQGDKSAEFVSVDESLPENPFADSDRRARDAWFRDSRQVGTRSSCSASGKPRHGDTLNFMVQGEATLSDDIINALRQDMDRLDVQTLWLAAALGTPVELLTADPPYSYVDSTEHRYTQRDAEASALFTKQAHDLNPPGVDED